MSRNPYQINILNFSMLDVMKFNKIKAGAGKGQVASKMIE
jgi:hypothetical protein